MVGGIVSSFSRLLTRVRSLLPKPRRKYEVDESSWLVIKGRATLKWLGIDAGAEIHGVRARAWFLLRWAYTHARSLGMRSLRWTGREAHEARLWFGVHWPGFAARARFGLRRARLTLRWRRVPKVWEMAFIDRMTAAEKMGIPFVQVLRDTLPGIMGIDGTRVLGYWTGSKSMLVPEVFVRETAKLFGKSSQQVVMGVFEGLDEGKLLVDLTPEEPKFQSVVDAIRRADDQKAMLKEMRERRSTAIVPVRGPDEP